MTIVTTALLLLALASIVRADSCTLTVLIAFTGGGGQLSAGGYTLVGAIGQPAAGTLQAGEFCLSAGVITAGAAPAVDAERVYLPVVRR